jgi:putative GTP pyrophosphokinase
MTQTLTEPSTFLPDERRFMLQHRFGLEEVVTKLHIMADEFKLLHSEQPIDHVTSRLKSREGLREKMLRKGLPVDGSTSWDAVRDQVRDVSGVRVVCPFVADVYRVFDLLVSQVDITLLASRDYIAHPKPNGYRSLHAIVRVPVFLSEGAVPIPVEVQLRTKAMDFWASLEHQIYYKYDREVPRDLLDGLRDAAEDAARLDTTMAAIHDRVRSLGSAPGPLFGGPGSPAGGTRGPTGRPRFEL